MAKLHRQEQLLEDWVRSSQSVPVSKIEPFLEHFFKGYWSKSKSGGSHDYKVQHPLFKKITHPKMKFGFYRICVSGGQHVKILYLRDLNKFIQEMKEIDVEYAKSLSPKND